MQWIPLSDERFDVRGLPWFSPAAPSLWRLPAAAAERMPKGVRQKMPLPGGGRIRFACRSSQLRVRFRMSGVGARWNMSPMGSRGLDLYVDGSYWTTICVDDAGVHECTFFEGAAPDLRDCTIYLPLFQALEVEAIGADDDAEWRPARPFAEPLPFVVYGSSIAQGSGACRGGMTYSAILARAMNLDFVNLGFGGSGKAEPEVVDIVSQIDACCYMFDLGKSYGLQDARPFTAMLERIRSARPEAGMICITPIFSTREVFDTSYVELSGHTREVVRQAVRARLDAGDERTVLVEGENLLGPDDADAFHEGVHPTDLGYALIAQRLRPILETLLPTSAKT